MRCKVLIREILVPGFASAAFWSWFLGFRFSGFGFGIWDVYPEKRCHVCKGRHHSREVAGPAAAQTDDLTGRARTDKPDVSKSWR